ncbi:MAG: type II toxin-antitoxin system PemK/MazF family toxin [Pseudonocardiaceae bacterium]
MGPRRAVCHVRGRGAPAVGGGGVQRPWHRRSGDATDSVTVCAFTTDPTEAPLLRIPISADAMNGLRQPSSLMVDKITTMSRSEMRERIGLLAGEDMVALGRAIVVFLGMAGP